LLPDDQVVPAITSLWPGSLALAAPHGKVPQAARNRPNRREPTDAGGVYRQQSIQVSEATMLRYIALFALGVPIPLIILIWAMGW
jgi:hypothetical protein